MAKQRKINEHGLALLKEFEGLALKAYRCPAGLWTIGYGHTETATPGMEITKEAAEELLRKDLRRFEQAVSKIIKVPLNDNEFSALVCFAYNVGAENLRASTLARLLNQGWYTQVPTQLIRWNKAKGKELAGLTRRRHAEGALWKAPSGDRS